MISSSIAELPLESFQSIEHFYEPVEGSLNFSENFSEDFGGEFDGEPVQLENLNARLKMILKLKLREFIHLSPFFQDIPAIDVSLYRVVPKTRTFMVAVQEDCPKRVPGFSPRRRSGRHIAL